jgi:hypothetical protein
LLEQSALISYSQTELLQRYGSSRIAAHAPAMSWEASLATSTQYLTAQSKTLLAGGSDCSRAMLMGVETAVDSKQKMG